MPPPIRRVDELGFPIPTKFEDFQTGSDEPRPPKRSVFQRLGRWRWLVLLLAPALLFGPQLIDFGRGIVANVQIQRAQQDLMDHDLQRALFHTSRAIAWEPDPERRAEFLSVRALVHEKLKHLDEGLHDYDEAIALVSQLKALPGPSIELATLYRGRARLHQRRRQNREALDDCKSAIAVCPKGRFGLDPSLYMELLNEKAYFSALSGLEVEDGLRTINEALNMAGVGNAAMLDTRACIQYRLGKYDLALNDMNVAIHLVETQRQNRQFGWDALPVFTPEDESVLDDQAFAVMYHHRGEIHRKLSADPKSKEPAETHRKQAEADLERAAQLRFDPQDGEALEVAPAERG
jgi:tetratricopeptide (TPR) repeat protein